MINDIVDKVFVISTLFGVERATYITKHLDSFNIKYDVRISPDRSFFTPFTHEGHEVKSAEQSLSSAYASIFYESIYYGYDKICIIEDDTKLIDNFKLEFEKFYSYVPNDWDVIHLGDYDNEKFIEKCNVNEHVDQIALKYVVNCMLYRGKALYENIINHIVKSKYQIDFVMNHVYGSGAKCYSPTTKLTYQLSYRATDDVTYQKFKSFME